MIKHKLWVEKYRPDLLEGYLGNESFLSSLKEWIDKNDLPNLLLFGGPGTGKTTAAKLIVKNIKCDHIYINCSDENGIDVIREKVKNFASAATFQPVKVIIMDEADFLTINAQAALRNIIETFSITTRFIFTCNYVERIIEPLQSRLAVYELNPPTPLEVGKHLLGILDKEEVSYQKNDVATLVKKFYPDIRKVLNITQSCVKSNELVLDAKLVNQTGVGTLILDQINKPSKDSFNTIRQILADNNVRDFTEFYKLLFDNTSSAIDIITIGESQYQSVTHPDKEICFMTCIAKLLNK
jgi:replication factor C small subunit